MQTVALYLCYIQYVCNERYFFFWTDQKNQPYLQFFWIYILSHHKIPIPIGLDAKVFLIQHWIKKPIHSVGDKIWRKSFEVYDTDSPIEEVW